jgi:hypothetical protein
MRAAITWSKVDFPLPLAPMTASFFPSWTVRSTPARAGILP